VPLDELESHLREEIEQRVKAGMDAQPAFELAAQELGPATALKNEFRKADSEAWNHPLAWAAWGTFAVSFGLPACTGMWGWQCALMSATAVSWPETWRGDWFSIHLSLLLLANLLMLASPFWLPRCAPHPRALRWLRGSSLVALVLVWWFVIRFFAHGDESWKQLQPGCYLWAVSFLLLARAACPRRQEKECADRSCT